MSKIDRWIRFRIRMYLWKKWKTNKNRERQLRKLEPANGKLKPGRILVNHTLDVRVHFFYP